MGDWPPDLAVPVTIWTGSIYGLNVGARDAAAGGVGWTSPAWGTANLAQFVPMQLPFRYPVRKMFTFNGSPVGGSVDLGIYSEDLVKVYSSGTVTQAGTNTLQFVPAAGTIDVILDPGVYYFAMASTSTTGTVGAQALGTATRQRYLGMFEQLTAFPLPAVATPAAVATQARIPLIGITALASPAF